MRVAVLTNLFPNHLEPGRAPFNKQQFVPLSAHCDLEVFAAIPRRFGLPSLGRGRIVRREAIDGLPVLHPRFLTIPGLPSINAAALAASVLPAMSLEHWLRGCRFDVLLASYAYPDGCAGIALARALGIPVVVKCHGSDLNRAPRDPGARAQLGLLLPRADAVVVVSKKLGERACELGVHPDRIRVVYNGVDETRFAVRDRGEARATLGIDRERAIVLYVGHLAEHKGTGDLVVAAERVLAKRSATTFVFVGAGPLLPEIERARAKLGGEQIAIAGHLSHDAVARWMNAANVLCLPSWDEGMPNVVREAHASGLPVVGTGVGGVPEAIHSRALGRLVPPRSPDALASAIEDALDARCDPRDVARLGRVSTWKESAAALYAVLAEVVNAR